MFLFLLGLVLFLGMHAFTMARGPRTTLVDRLGEGGYKALYVVISLIGIVMLWKGFGDYRAAGYIPVWNPPTWTRHLALLLMLPVFPLLFAAYLPGEIKRRAKHPMLLAVKFWALAHFLANGDLGSMILFLAFLAWAVAARIAAKKRGDTGGVVPLGTNARRNDLIALGAGLAFYMAFVMWLHPALIGVAVITRAV